MTKLCAVRFISECVSRVLYVGILAFSGLNKIANDQFGGEGMSHSQTTASTSNRFARVYPSVNANFITFIRNYLVPANGFSETREHTRARLLPYQQMISYANLKAYRLSLLHTRKFVSFFCCASFKYFNNCFIDRSGAINYFRRCLVSECVFLSM